MIEGKKVMGVSRTPTKTRRRPSMAWKLLHPVEADVLAEVDIQAAVASLAEVEAAARAGLMNDSARVLAELPDARTRYEWAAPRGRLWAVRVTPSNKILITTLGDPPEIMRNLWRDLCTEERYHALVAQAIDDDTAADKQPQPDQEPTP